MQLYDQHVAEMAANPEIKDVLSKSSGLRENSCLNELKYFHVCCGLPPDIMHDILEGSLQYELKLLLQQLIRNKHLSIDQVNENFVI